MRSRVPLTLILLLFLFARSRSIDTTAEPLLSRPAEFHYRVLHGLREKLIQNNVIYTKKGRFYMRDTSMEATRAAKRWDFLAAWYCFLTNYGREGCNEKGFREYAPISILRDSDGRIRRSSRFQRECVRPDYLAMLSNGNVDADSPFNSFVCSLIADRLAVQNDVKKIVNDHEKSMEKYETAQARLRRRQARRGERRMKAIMRAVKERADNSDSYGGTTDGAASLMHHRSQAYAGDMPVLKISVAPLQPYHSRALKDVKELKKIEKEGKVVKGGLSPWSVGGALKLEMLMRQLQDRQYKRLFLRLTLRRPKTIPF